MTGLTNRLVVRITAAFMLASVLGVALVALLAYRSTTIELSTFIGHMEGMQGMMGGMMGPVMMGPLGEAQRVFLDNLGQSLIIAGLAGVAVAILLGGLLARHIAAPLGKVTTAARRVARGDLEQRVDIHSSGELAELGDSFNRMAEALRHDRQLRQNMMADIAHELRTPVSILQGNVEAMLDGILDVNADNLTSLHQETLLLARLVEDLRTLSLAEAGQLQFHRQATDLKELSAQALERFKARAIARNIEISLDAPDGLPPVWSDPDRTAQVMHNLLGNALHYTPEGGKVTIRLSADGSGVTAEVTDSGIGISPEALPHVFDRFYRVDRSRTRSTGGLGLGLSIAKQLVEAQGGRIWASSQPGAGSTFAFSLPYAP